MAGREHGKVAGRERGVRVEGWGDKLGRALRGEAGVEFDRCCRGCWGAGEPRATV